MTSAHPDDAPFRRTDPLPPERPEGDGVDAWLGELASDEAARRRSRDRSLGRQAAEEGTFTGVLVDLAERGRPVVVHLHNGRWHRGLLSMVGTDFVVIRDDAGRDVAIARSALASVRTLPREAATVGDRS